MFYEVIPTEIFRQNSGILTYHSDQPLAPGHIVLVPLGKRVVTGIVLKKVPKVNFPTKPISCLIHPIPLPTHLLKSITWLSRYYLAPLPVVANLFLPAGLISKKLIKSPTPSETNNSDRMSNANLSFSGTSAGHDRGRDARHPQRRDGVTSFPEMTVCAAHSIDISLNSAQKSALKALSEAPGATRLLRGVTGSGKTNIYLKMASETLKEQKSVILLVPEIALTSQLVKIFTQTFGNRIILIHSNQTLVERRTTWLSLLTATSDKTTKLDTPNGYNSKSRPLTGEFESRAQIVRDRSVEELSKAAADKGRLDDSAAQDMYDCSSEKLPQVTTEGAGRATPATAGWRDVRFEDERYTHPEPLIVIGPRSALLAPLHNLGLIIIDESHESAYYQENSPRYSALRLASFIANSLKIPCIQGTATPNIVDFNLAKTHNSLIELTTKAKTTAITPKITIVDLKNRANFLKNRYFSNQILTAIEKNIQAKHQTLIFHNRRGSSPLTICEECGWQALCPTCYLPMTLHTDGYLLTCHICGHEEKVPTGCPNCNHPGIIHKGFGTKLLESELTRLFPKTKIARFDGDNNKKNSLNELYNDVKSGKIDILIGTQTLARGLDLPHLATVGVVQADAGLSLPDYTAEERTFELLTQVIGRVGRGHLDHAEVIIQTYQPDHPVIQTATKSDFPAFTQYLLPKRHTQKLPPYTYLARLSITYKTEKTTITKINQIFRTLNQNPKLTISPPTPAFHERTAQGYTWQIIAKSTSRETLRQALMPFSMYRIELDPPSLL